VINHLDEGCGVRATARLVQVSKDTVARLLRLAGRHAERFHDQRVRDVTPRALEFDEQWSFVKRSKSVATCTRPMKSGTCGTIPRSPPTASSWSLWWSASVRRNRPILWCKSPSVVSGRGICRALHRCLRGLRVSHLRGLWTSLPCAQTRARRSLRSAAATLATRVGLWTSEKNL
jgi:hypothetical protein